MDLLRSSRSSPSHTPSSVYDLWTRKKQKDTFRWRRYVLAVGLLISLKTYIEILIHYGITLCGNEMIPKIYPNSCGVSWLAEGRGGGMAEGSWPCAREKILEVWWRGNVGGVLREGFQGADFWVGAVVIPLMAWYWASWEVWKRWNKERKAR